MQTMCFPVCGLRFQLNKISQFPPLYIYISHIFCISLLLTTLTSLPSIPSPKLFRYRGIYILPEINSKSPCKIPMVGSDSFPFWGPRPIFRGVCLIGSVEVPTYLPPKLWGVEGKIPVSFHEELVEFLEDEFFLHPSFGVFC